MKILPDNIAGKATDHKDIFATFTALAEIASDIPLRYFNGDLTVQTKSDNTPVTQADRETEQAMRQVIMATHPTHGIIGEEYGNHNEAGDYQWVIDPIDGTKSFICGMPLFGSLIGLLHNGKATFGMTVMPVLEQVFFGSLLEDERGAWRNGEIIRTGGEVTDLRAARFSIGEGNKFCEHYPHAAKILSPQLSMLRFYHDCYSFALLASGGLHGVIEIGLQAYDILPIVPLIEGAGGCISDWHGAPLGQDFDGTVLACANEDLHRQALRLLQDEFLMERTV